MTLHMADQFSTDIEETVGCLDHRSQRLQLADTVDKVADWVAQIFPVLILQETDGVERLFDAP